MIDDEALSEWVRGLSPDEAVRALVALGVEPGTLADARAHPRSDRYPPLLGWTLTSEQFTHRSSAASRMTAGALDGDGAVRLAVTTDALPPYVLPRLLAATAVESAFVAVERAPGSLRWRPWRWPLRIGILGAGAERALELGEEIGRSGRFPPRFIDVRAVDHDPGAVDVLVVEAPLADATAAIARQKPAANAVLVVARLADRWPVASAQLATIRAATAAVASALLAPRSLAELLTGLIYEASHAQPFDVALTRAARNEVLRGVLQTATERRYLGVNPCDAVRLPKKRQANGADSADERMIFLTPSEVAQLVQAMPEHYRTATWVAAYCGLRAGEMWALRRKDVDLLTGTLYVRQALKEVNGGDADTPASEKGLIFGPPKSKASRRRLTLPAPIKALLAEHLSHSLPGGDGRDALIFTTPSGKPMRHGLFYRRVFAQARTALPTDKRAMRWHDLRHTAASLSLAVTPSLHLDKERLGHEDIRTTINTYGHLLPSVEEGLNDGLAALFVGAAPATPDNVVDLRATS